MNQPTNRTICMWQKNIRAFCVNVAAAAVAAFGSGNYYPN